MCQSIRCGVFCALALGLAGFSTSAVLAVSPGPADAARDDALAEEGIYLPYHVENPTTPPTRAISAEEAEAVLRRDWLFQAEGKPLERRAAEEIGWARRLAERLARNSRAADLKSDLAELDAIEKRLGGPAADASLPPAAVVDAMPQWIWFPEGRAAEDAPAEPRYFRRAFDVPAEGSERAELRITADDSCSVYLNGVHLGNHAGWNQAAVYTVQEHMKPGRNVLAVRAENSPYAGKNPAGLIACLTLLVADGRRMHVVSDASWRAANGETPRWQQPELDDSSWKAAALAADGGQGPWGHRLVGLGPPDPILAYAGVAPAVKEAYFAVRRVKRRIAMANPVVDFSKLLFIDQPYPRGRVNDTHESIHRMGITATPGGRLLLLDGLHPGGDLRLLAPRDRPGSFWRPALSFDAARVLFCYKAHDEKAFHLYEMGLDGSGLRQLTDSDYDDIDPIYLPDGHILFTTTRGNSHVRCGPFIYSYILARCDADGKNIYLISYNGEPDFMPSLLNDGRVIYSRWEYSDKPLWRLQKLWTTNPDGTGTVHFWGNQSVWPDHLSEPQPIPGSRRVMFSGVGHHDWWSGSIGIIDPDKGRDFPHGLTKATADLRWPECSLPPLDPIEAADYHSAGQFTGYKTALPLSEEDFLVSARGEAGKFRLYLMDVYGNREVIYEGVHNIWHAIPVKPRRAPPQPPDRVVWPGTGKQRKPVEPGVFFSSDVCQGVPELPRGTVKYLRVFQLDYKTYTTWKKTYRHSGPAVSIVQEEGVKRILSEVPVETDGSVHFVAPAGYSLFFQLLDGDRRCVQTMRSFTVLMPGERRG
ncbi:MAG: PD40 domain-containing protein, partial [Pirellulales bacterium]|nr:PD40 domain-containing protein [Pirellulales bacterium]